VVSIQLLNDRGESLDQLASGQSVTIRVGYRCREHTTISNAAVTIVFNRDDHVQSVFSSVAGRDTPMTFEGEGFVDVIIPALPFTGGRYLVDADRESEVCHDAINATEVQVVDGDYYGTGRIRPTPHWKDVGVLVPYRVEPVMSPLTAIAS